MEASKRFHRVIELTVEVLTGPAPRWGPVLVVSVNGDVVGIGAALHKTSVADQVMELSFLRDRRCGAGPYWFRLYRRFPRGSTTTLVISGGHVFSSPARST
jgi:hypothetical protein